MRLPIIKRLKKREYREIATFQDYAIDILYRSYSDMVLHGGTVIWRCFSGNSFSNDIDAYLDPNINLEDTRDKLKSAAEEQGIRVEKVKDTGNLMFIGFSLGDTYLKVEISHFVKCLKPMAMRFERVDGTYSDIISISANDLVAEKIAAYRGRRFIRDIYDIYILSSYIERDKNTIRKISDFLNKMPPPVNEEDLASLIYEGPVPSLQSMLMQIRGRLS